LSYLRPLFLHTNISSIYAYPRGRIQLCKLLTHWRWKFSTFCVTRLACRRLLLVQDVNYWRWNSLTWVYVLCDYCVVTNSKSPTTLKCI
jgi:hypothetical protein